MKVVLDVEDEYGKKIEAHVEEFEKGGYWVELIYSKGVRGAFQMHPPENIEDLADSIIQEMRSQGILVTTWSGKSN